MVGPRGALHELSRAIGALEEGIRQLTKRVDIEAEVASKHRDSLRQVIAAQTEAMRMLSQWKEDWEPLLREYRDLRTEAEGRRKLRKALLAVWLTVSGFLGAIATKLIEYFWTFPPSHR